MNALLALLSLTLAVSVVALAPADGPAAVVLFLALGAGTALLVSRHESHGRFLVQVFVAALLVRAGVGLIIYTLQFQEFFGGDALTYDAVGATLSEFWLHGVPMVEQERHLGAFVQRNWGMSYLVASIYALTGRNMLAVQFFNAVVGAATAPVIFLCARHIFQNLRVARLATLLVAFYPSLVLWSSQGLKDGPIVFLLTLCMLTTLKLGERITAKHLAVLVLALYGLLTLRFYIFYMTAAAIGGAFLIGMRAQTARSLARQFVIIVAAGLALTYLGVLRTAGTQLELYGDLEAVQRSRADLARSASSGFGQDVDVSTTSGALSAIPVGMIYLLFAPFPWQVANLRQGITIPEMVIWWGSFPLLVLGIWFTLKFRLRQALPIVLFTAMLTLAYSVFQGNVGTAYRQRSQILVFYFIFVAVGFVLLKERQEDNARRRREVREAELAALRALRPAPAPSRRQMTLPPMPPRRGAASPPRAAGPARDAAQL
jgi:hypothetical protein